MLKIRLHYILRFGDVQVIVAQDDDHAMIRRVHQLQIRDKFGKTEYLRAGVPESQDAGTEVQKIKECFSSK
jgi:hypothetical protein